MSRKHGTSDPSTGKETLDADFAANGSIDYDDPIQYQRQDLYREETTRETADHVAEIIGLLGEDVEREGLVKTPERVAKAYQLLTHGYGLNPDAILISAIIDENSSET